MSVGILKRWKSLSIQKVSEFVLLTIITDDARNFGGIASNSKGFTCTALAILADEGKLNWDDKVTKFYQILKCMTIM